MQTISPRPTQQDDLTPTAKRVIWSFFLVGLFATGVIVWGLQAKKADDAWKREWNGFWVRTHKMENPLTNRWRRFFTVYEFRDSTLIKHGGGNFNAVESVMGDIRESGDEPISWADPDVYPLVFNADGTASLVIQSQFRTSYYVFKKTGNGALEIRIEEPNQEFGDGVVMIGGNSTETAFKLRRMPQSFNDFNLLNTR